MPGKRDMGWGSPGRDVAIVAHHFSGGERNARENLVPPGTTEVASSGLTPRSTRVAPVSADFFTYLFYLTPEFQIFILNAPLAWEEVLHYVTFKTRTITK